MAVSNNRIREFFIREHSVINATNRRFMVLISMGFIILSGFFGIQYRLLHLVFYVDVSASLSLYAASCFYARPIRGVNASNAPPYNETEKSNGYLPAVLCGSAAILLLAHVALVLLDVMKPVFILDYSMPLLFWVLIGIPILGAVVVLWLFLSVGVSRLRQAVCFHEITDDGTETGDE